MQCDQAREAIVDSLVEDAPANAALDAHLAGCDACRSFRDEGRALWSGLAELPVPVAAAGARARFDQALKRVERTRSVWTRGRVALIAAGLIVAALLGYGVASRPAPLDTTPRYLLLLYDSPQKAGSEPPSPAVINALIAEYSAWARGLRAEGRLVSAEKLTDDGGQWFGGAASVASDDRVGGFFVIRAKTPAEAQAIAESCPHLKHHGRVELRAIHPT